MQLWENSLCSYHFVFGARRYAQLIGHWQIHVHGQKLFGNLATTQLEMSPRLHCTVADQEELQTLRVVSRELPKPVVLGAFMYNFYSS